MRILLFGGFLGAGKTTVIRAFIDALCAQKQGTVAVIENEIGQVGVDDALLEKGTLTVKPLLGGCVCCEIIGNLIGAVAEIEKTLAPAWLIVEMTGAAEAGHMRGVLQHAVKGVEMHTISVVDASRWIRLRTYLEDFMHGQLDGCDALIVNKADLCGNVTEIIDDVSAFSGVRNVTLMSDSSDRIAACAAILGRLVPNGFSGGHDSAYADHEHDACDHDEQVADVAVFSRVLSIDWADESEFQNVLDRVKTLFEEIGRAVSRGDTLFGHAKGLLRDAGLEYARLSVTRPGPPDVLFSECWHVPGKRRGPYSLLVSVNSMAHTPEELERLVLPCLERARL